MLAHRHPAVTPLLVLLSVALAVSQASSREQGPPAPERVQQLAAILPAKPQGIGPTIADRTAWETVGRHKEFQDCVADARQLLDRPMPEMTDDVYLDYSRTGNRSRGQKVIGDRHGRMPVLVIAECIENKGLFLPAIEAAIRAECAEKSWTLPAHDRDLKSFRGEQPTIDLHAANEAWNLATADYWLGDKLSPEVRKLIRAEIGRRVFAPYESNLRGGPPKMFWPTTTNNWNAVCLAGVTGAAMTILEKPAERAYYAAAAEKLIQNFLDGFTDDGYCSEGVGYWNYGFGHFIMLAETLHQQTGGKLDLFAKPRVESAAMFARRLEILPGVFPAFADCKVGTRPDRTYTAFMMRRLGQPVRPDEAASLGLGMGPSKMLFELGIFGLENSAIRVPPGQESGDTHALRDYFADAGIVVTRAADANPPFAVALKGGHNDEHHNHNDVGSFVIAVGRSTPLLDPGSEVYTARTFSSKRYVSNVLNSFGHPVPKVAGQLQQPGRKAAAKVLRTDFTEEKDSIVLDLSAAYNVKSLKQLTRTFTFSRQNGGELRVRDEFVFAAPELFETALITFSEYARQGDGGLIVGKGRDAVTVDIEMSGPVAKLTFDEINEDLRPKSKPTRIGIGLGGKAKSGHIELRIRPAGR
ncbi:MAG: hypothetical protein ACOY3P_07490 [Planctomycetota bacterium]